MESQKIPPQPPGTARAPCPLPERSGISSDNADPQQNSMWPQVTEGMRKLTTKERPKRGIPKTVRKPSLSQIDDVEYFRRLKPRFSNGIFGKQGRLGKPIELLSNFFPLTLSKNWYLYQYKVEFNPQVDRISTKRELLAQHQDYLGAYFFHETNLYSSRQFHPAVFEFLSMRHSNNQIITIKISLTNIIQSGGPAINQVFDKILNDSLRHLKLTLIGRNFCDPKAKIDMPQHKLQLWPGYKTEIGIHENNLLLCVKLSTKVIRQETVFDFYNQCAADSNINEDWLSNFKMAVVGTTVMTTYNNTFYKIDDIDENIGLDAQVIIQNGSKINFIQYYKEKWNVTIRGGNQPLLISKKKISLQRFEDEKPFVYLVPELCIMTGITKDMRNNATLMEDITIHSCVNPKEQIERITNFANRIFLTPDCKTELQRWNLTLSNTAVEVTGRTLIPRIIQFGNVGYGTGIETDWTKHVIQSPPILTGATVKCWVILAPQDSSEYVNTFAKSLISAGEMMSFKLPMPEIIFVNDSGSILFLSHLECAINRFNPALILCVIPTKRSVIYHMIKRKLCVDRAVQSQVVPLKKVQDNNRLVCSKIAIKINCKLGGVPWLVPNPKKGIMIIGFYTCRLMNKSFFSFVATMDDTLTKYFSCAGTYGYENELFIRFSNVVTKAIMKYNSINMELPTSVILYRGGVDERQLSYVHKSEVNNFKSSCEFFYECPKYFHFMFILVSERVNARFFYKSNENPTPGTIIDTVVTDPTKYDFFLVSQYKHEGTVSPTHYQVIEDTLRIKPGEIQDITFNLTHMYYNVPGTIRVPAPCQMAKKLLKLTSQSLGCSPNTKLEETLYYL